MSRYTHKNAPSGPVIDRRVFIAVAGVAVAGCAFAGIRGCVAGSSDSIDVIASDAISSKLVNDLAEKMGSIFRDVNLTVLSDADMSAGKLVSRVSGSRSWLVFGANEESANALASLECLDWIAWATNLQDSLAFTFDGSPLRAFPLEGDIGMLLCNKSLLDSAGVGTTSNVDELAYICTFLAEAGIEPLALDAVDAGSRSLNLCLDASLAYWSSAEHPEPESLDEAVAVLAASALRCGRREDGSTPFETREDALLAFKEGDAAMIFASSSEFGALGDIDFPCLCVPIPTLSGDASPVLRPARSVVCSAKLPEEACTAVLNCLQSSDGAGAAGMLAPFRNESGGLTMAGLPATASVSIMPPNLIDGDVLDGSARQGYQERIVALWNQDEIEPIAYANEVEVEI